MHGVRRHFEFCGAFYCKCCSERTARGVSSPMDPMASTALSEADFKAAVKALPGRVILLLDACHSGALIENDRRGGEGLTDKLD